MATHMQHSGPAMLGPRRRATNEFRVIYLVSFTYFLVTAGFSRLFPRDGANRRTLIEEARASARTCAPFAFMG